MNAKLVEWISENVKHMNKSKKEKVVYCWETTGLLDVWDGERRARLLQQALPQLSLYAGSAFVVGPGMLFPSLVMKAAATRNPSIQPCFVKLWMGLNRIGSTGPASVVNIRCTCVCHCICSIATIEKSISRGRKVELHVGILLRQRVGNFETI